MTASIMQKDPQQRRTFIRNTERKNSKNFKNLDGKLSGQSFGGSMLVNKNKPANMTDMTIMYSEPIVK